MGEPVGVGSQIGNQASLDARSYGYRKLSGLVEAMALFDIRRDGQTVLLWRRGAFVGPVKKAAKATAHSVSAVRVAQKAAQKASAQKVVTKKGTKQAQVKKAPAKKVSSTKAVAKNQPTKTGSGSSTK